MGDKKPIVFFVRNLPQGADIIEFVLKEKKVFVGYPPFKKCKECEKVEWDQGPGDGEIKKCMFDISEFISRPDEIKEMGYVHQNSPKADFRRQVIANINLCRDAVKGSFVIVPRLKKGKCYVGKIKGFKLVEKPKWREYKKIREEQGLPPWNEKKHSPQYHIGDIVQSWEVEGFKEISADKLPEEMKKSLSAPRSAGRVKDPSAYGWLCRKFK